jgi:hypothetical protein
MAGGNSNTSISSAIDINAQGHIDRSITAMDTQVYNPWNARNMKYLPFFNN